ncbi:MAG: type II toxin-antitoxin system RelE/ParE family toxin, partial [Burkholderiaceae bacterium]|nr:type II toxin-antitoxin system RelE/ParE family toxin [Burkholderiaceae bacterium]
MKVFIALRLQRVIKKLSKNEKNALDQSIEIISKQPKIGTLKTGD